LLDSGTELLPWLVAHSEEWLVSHQPRVWEQDTGYRGTELNHPPLEGAQGEVLTVVCDFTIKEDSNQSTTPYQILLNKFHLHGTGSSRLSVVTWAIVYCG
jgi:hypothetical protein